MNTQSLLQKTALLVVSNLAQKIERVFPKMDMALLKHEAHGEDCYRVNYTKEDRKFLGEMCAWLRSWSTCSYDFIAQAEKFFSLIDRAFPKYIADHEKDSLKAVIDAEIAKQEDNPKELIKAELRLQIMAAEKRFCYACAFCVHSSEGVSDIPNDFICKKLNITHQRYSCPDIDYRLLKGSDKR
ncbi:MAG: hypothetical protein LRY75_17735 [Shewanella xiamenensis]|nr:hypothetical protein [Shewanella xiamenensis]